MVEQLAHGDEGHGSVLKRRIRQILEGTPLAKTGAARVMDGGSAIAGNAAARHGVGADTAIDARSAIVARK